MQQVQKSGCNGFADEEIYGMAVHYYDEDDIKDIESVRCTVVVNHTVVLTEEEIKQAKADAIQKAQDEAYAKLTTTKSLNGKQSPKIVLKPLCFIPHVMVSCFINQIVKLKNI